MQKNGSSRKKVLVIDDDVSVANLYSDLLRAAGFQVELAHDGEAGLAKIKEYQPDLVQLELMLPKVGGVEIIQAIRAQSEGTDLPVLVFSSSYDSETIAAAWEAGATEYLMKGQSAPKVVVQTIREMLGMAKPPATVRAQKADQQQITRKSMKLPAIQAQRIQEEAATLHQQVLHSIYDAVLLVDLDGKIVESNARAEEFLRASREELQGKRAWSFIYKATGALMDEIRASLDEGRYTLLDAYCLRKDRTYFPAEIAVSLAKVGDGGKVLCFLIRDITARKRAEKALQKAQEDRIKTERVKERLHTVSTLTHEINNPLQMLLTLAEKDDNPLYRQQVERIVAILRELHKDEALVPITGPDGVQRFHLEVPAAKVPCTPGSLLIVDDEALMVRLFKELLLLEFPDVTVTEANDGKVGIEAFASGHQAVVILDIAMPVMGGEEAFAQIEALCRQKNWEMPHVLFCTGFTPPDSVVKTVGDGSQHGLLMKPFTMSDLNAGIRKHLQPGAGNQAPSKG